MCSTLTQLFTPDVIARLARVRRPNPSPHDFAGEKIRQRHILLGAVAEALGRSERAFRDAWSVYLYASEACGLLDKRELRTNLTDDDDENFRGAMAECLTAWYFSERLGMTVHPKPGDPRTRNVDLQVSLRDLVVDVEVKAPHICIESNPYPGDDSKELRTCIEAAGRQFKKGRRNMVVIVPLLRTPLCLHREQLVKATIGARAIQVLVAREPGVTPPPPEAVFLQKGKLAKLWPKDWGTGTDLTRISAVMTIEEELAEVDEECDEVQHYVVVVHNPFAEFPIPPESLGTTRQLVPSNEGMIWMDGYPGR